MGEIHFADEFSALVLSLRAFTPRPEIETQEMPPPLKLAPHAFALTAECYAAEVEIANGRFVLLYQPGGEETWGGQLRIVTFIKADIEAELSLDPLLTEVAWSWFEESLAPGSATALSGTVTLARSSAFGELSARKAQSELEIRASWTALAENTSDVIDHLANWSELLAHCAGLPPLSHGDGVATMVRRG